MDKCNTATTTTTTTPTSTTTSTTTSTSTSTSNTITTPLVLIREGIKSSFLEETSRNRRHIIY